MIPRKALPPCVMVGALVTLDCYLDDLYGFLGIPAETVFGPAGGLIIVFLGISLLLLVLTAYALLLLCRHLRPVGWARMAWLFLSAHAVAVAAGNLLIRMILLARYDVVSQLTVPPFYFAETYATRLTVYLAICLTALALLVATLRRGLRRRLAVGSFLAVAAMLAASASLLAGGMQTLAESPYWEGEPITHGSLYMGTFPRTYAAVVEPWATMAFLTGFLLVLAGIPSLRAEPHAPCLLALAGAILVQAIPRLGRGLLTEALYAADFYYAFRLDRSLAFPLLPVLALSVAVCASRIARGNTQGPVVVPDKT